MVFIDGEVLDALRNAASTRSSDLRDTESSGSPVGIGSPGKLHSEDDLGFSEGSVFVDDQASDDAFSRIVRMVTKRDKCTEEVRRRLFAEGYDGSAIDCAVSRAIACGLLDDIRYADVLIRTRISQGKGRDGIIRELSSCGIDPCDIPDWPDGYFDSSDGDGEFLRAVALLERKPSRSKNVQAGSYRKLLQHGYSSAVASRAVRAYLAKTGARS